MLASGRRRRVASATTTTAAVPSVLPSTATRRAGTKSRCSWASGIVEPVVGSSIPEAQDHLDFVPARLVAVVGNTLGTAAVVVVALATLRRRPLANILILAGVAVAAAGSAVAGLGEAESAIFVAVAAVLFYVGFLAAVGARPVLAELLPGPRAKPTMGKPET